ncbi:copper radical oxidase [Tilletiaria anomala UBC 951]|uniref:Copper radical oxidase n=1 Tax=Tilletiaria anomala (strain ATCC 24038 / CBS 436.72 / UBC 951) TaxID=1037660 RepID=A0A066WI05_TILAU|nr:copper radical oxidase [Tilletiaria anomala UBC 951]KDN52163.1 copper radical oxidase [Tilletiaria anomala UBC 951]
MPFNSALKLKSILALAASLGLLSASGASGAKGGTIQVVSQNAGISAQMMFLGTDSTVYMLDKAENNPAKVNGHPAWATVYDFNSNTYQSMDVSANPFCAGGADLGDGRMLVTGGNKAVGSGGGTVEEGSGPYQDYDGGHAIRTLKPGSGATWKISPNALNAERWYPTVEPLKDGYVMIIGGMRDGGYVPTSGSVTASYEFYPPKGDGRSRNLDFLNRTTPLSLFPISFLMSNGEMFMQANKQAILWNYQKQSETRLPNAQVPKVYPASAGSVLLPLEPDSNYLETVLFCGGLSLGSAKKWGNEGGVGQQITNVPASTICEQIEPVKSQTWEAVDNLPSGRSMGQFITLPDGKLLFINGVKKGTAGYNTDPSSVGKPVGQSYGDDPEYTPYLYDPKATKGTRWSAAGGKLFDGRLYHSSATLLPDSSVLIAGSNPNADVTTTHWKTTYSVERWYPTWYDQTRPSNSGLPSSFSYGGDGFQLIFSNPNDAANAKVKIIRTGFSTHAMNMGQRSITLRSVAKGNTLYVGQLPNNPNLFAPGRALAFVVVNGVASQGKFVMVGNGKIGTQPTSADTQLPSVTTIKKTPSSSIEKKQATKKTHSTATAADTPDDTIKNEHAYTSAKVPSAEESKDIAESFGSGLASHRRRRAHSINGEVF